MRRTSWVNLLTFAFYGKTFDIAHLSEATFETLRRNENDPESGVFMISTVWYPTNFRTDSHIAAFPPNLPYASYRLPFQSAQLRIIPQRHHGTWGQ
jgi:hypothetical protein